MRKNLGKDNTHLATPAGTWHVNTGLQAWPASKAHPEKPSLQSLVWSLSHHPSSSLSCSVSIYEVPILWPWGRYWGRKEAQTQTCRQTDYSHSVQSRVWAGSPEGWLFPLHCGSAKAPKLRPEGHKATNKAKEWEFQALRLGTACAKT